MYKERRTLPDICKYIDNNFVLELVLVADPAPTFQLVSPALEERAQIQIPALPSSHFLTVISSQSLLSHQDQELSDQTLRRRERFPRAWLGLESVPRAPRPALTLLPLLCPI